MRCVESRRSSLSDRALSVVAIQRTAVGSAGPAWDATASSHSASSPAEASGSASCQASGTSCSSSHAPIASSASAASSPSRAVAAAARAIACALSSRNAAASSRSTPDSTNSRITPSRTSSASARPAAVRLRGRDRVVELVREAGRHAPERGELLALLLGRARAAAITGRKARITRRNAIGVSNSRRRNSGGVDQPDARPLGGAHRDLRRHLASAMIAPAQSGRRARGPTPRARRRVR